MSKAFCVTDKAVQRVLSTIEAMPDYVFAETELTRLSQSGFSSLKELKLITWQQFDWEHELFVSRLPGDIGTLRYLRKRDDGKYWAYPENDESKDRIEVDEIDLPHWIFDIAKLVCVIKEANSLSGDSEAIVDDLRYVGTDSVNRIAVYVGFFDDDNKAAAALIAIPKQNHEGLFVVCPTFNISQKAVNAVKMNIKTMTLAEAFTDGWKLRLCPQRKKRAVSNKYGYKSEHVLMFLDEKGPYRSYYIQIDSREKFRIPYSKFALLLFMAIKIKDDPQGWINKKETDSEEITDDSNINHLHALVSELRELLRGQVKDPESFIETNRGRGTVRLSIPVTNIKRPPDTRWMKRVFNAVKIEVKKARG